MMNQSANNRDDVARALWAALEKAEQRGTVSAEETRR